MRTMVTAAASRTLSSHRPRERKRLDNDVSIFPSISDASVANVALTISALKVMY